MNKLLGVYIGRCCPPHIGHARIIESMLQEHGVDKSLVMIGSSSSPISYRNLFTLGDRQMMLKMLFPTLNTTGIPDHESDEGWFGDVWSTINCWRHMRDDERVPDIQRVDAKQVMFYAGCEEDVLFLVDRGYQVKILNRFDGSGPTVSATEVRDALVHNRDVSGLVPHRIENFVKERFASRWDEMRKR